MHSDPPPLSPCRLTRSRKHERRRAVAIWGMGLLAICAAFVLALAVGLRAGPVAAAAGSALLVWLVLADRLWMRRPGGVPCLTWHSVSADAGWLPWADAISVRPETLDRQLALLGRMGLRAMDSVEFCKARRAGKPVSPDTVLLHFDDGYLDNWVAAAPILQRHGMRATLFVSLDFIAPERDAPLTLADTTHPPRWDGYLSWGEIAALDAGAFGGVFDIQPHGVDHGRVPVGPRIVDRLSAQNWRRLAWMQWAEMPGDKHDWYRAQTPPARPLGTPVPESDGALAAPALTPDGRESRAAYAARVRRDLRACRTALRARLGKEAALFCWPQNLTSDLARDIAAQAGYLATTAGKGSNRCGEPAAILSRLHVGERVGGFACDWLDDLVFRAGVRCFQGNHYWYLAILGANLIARVHGRLSAPLRRAPRPQRVAT